MLYGEQGFDSLVTISMVLDINVMYVRFKQNRKKARNFSGAGLCKLSSV